MNLTSPAFGHGGKIPSKYTCDGENVNPLLSISDPPEGVKSYALIVDDPDAPMGIWVHWVVWNLPKELMDIHEKETLGVSGTNDFKKLGYGGPCPPPGPSHTYRFKLYALDSMLELKQGAAKQELEHAMQGHVLAQVELDGEYQR